MSTESQAQKDARLSSGRFGNQTFTPSEVTVNGGRDPVQWSVEIEYSSGPPDVIVVNEDGHLPRVHRSDSRTLTDLVRFVRRSPGLEFTVTFADAISDPGSVTGFNPIFWTTEDATTTVRGTVKSFIQL